MSENKRLVFEASTVEGALRLASDQWDIPPEDLNYVVLGEEKVFLGLFGKKLKVEVWVQTLPERCVSFTNKLLQHMGLHAEAQLQEDGSIEVTGQDAEILVGRSGDGLKSTEYLVNLALRDPGQDPRVRFDCNGYRDRRTRSLERLAEATARRVVEQGRPVRLEPMLSWERWVIHTTLKDRGDIRTESIGDFPHRKVIVLPKGEAGAGSAKRHRTSGRSHEDRGQSRRRRR